MALLDAVHIVHVAKINLRCEYVSFILVEKVSCVKTDLQTKSNIERTFPTKPKILKKGVEMMLRLVFEKNQIEKLKTNLYKLYLLITTY
jgi:hypothetical protein